MLLFFFFFFQAEDGIRDKLVTGVQTCALPISRRLMNPGRARNAGAILHGRSAPHLCARPRRALQTGRPACARRRAARQQLPGGTAGTREPWIAGDSWDGPGHGVPLPEPCAQLHTPVRENLDTDHLRDAPPQAPSAPVRLASTENLPTAAPPLSAAAAPSRGATTCARSH